MIGATWTVLRVGDLPTPSLVIGALLIVLAVLSWRKARSSGEQRFSQAAANEPQRCPLQCEHCSAFSTSLTITALRAG